MVSIRFLPGFHSFHAWAAIFDGHLYPPVEKPSAAPAPPIQWEGVVERALPFSTRMADEALYNRFQRNRIQKE